MRNSIPSSPLSWIVLRTMLTATRPLRSMPSSVLLAKTLSLKVPPDSFPKSAPSPFAIIRLCEMSTRALARTPSTPFAMVRPTTALPLAREPNSITAFPAQPAAPPQ